MNITIIGAGNMGRGIGTRLAAGGHSVTFIDRKPEQAKKVANEVKAFAKNGVQISTASLEDDKLGDVVVLAVPYGANIELTKKLGSKLEGKVVVDIANPLNDTYDGFATKPDSSSAEDVAKVAAPDAKVIKAFNTTFASTLLAGQVAGRPLDIFIAGDDETAKKKIEQLAKDGGMRPIDTGPLSRARQIEAMQFLHITLQGSLGTNWDSTVKILS